MTATTLDYPATLRAIADHIEKHDLGDRTLMSVDAAKHRTGVAVNLYGSAAFRAWLDTLTDITVQAHVYNPGRLYIEAFGQVDDLPVNAVYVCKLDQEPAVYDAVLSTLRKPKSRKAEPIELPEILTGGTR